MPDALPLGRPQFFAALLLIAFLLQCAWAIQHGGMSEYERARVDAGLKMWRGKPVETETPVSPIPALLASAPMAAFAASADDVSPQLLPWLARAGFVAVGLLLGASIWYVGRRLFGAGGAFIALAFYCFMPHMVLESVRPRGGIIAAWTAFGIIYIAIALGHTLYGAPGWKKHLRRTVLLAFSIGIAIACDSATVLFLALAVLLLMYLVPGRRADALAVLAVACAIAFVLWIAAWGFNFHDAWQVASENVQLRLAAKPNFFVFPKITLALLLLQYGPSVPIVVIFAVTVWIVWTRARWFGNTSALLVAVLSVSMWLFATTPIEQPLLRAAPFLYLFFGGVFADLFETRGRGVAIAMAVVFLAGHALFAMIFLQVIPQSFLLRMR